MSRQPATQVLLIALALSGVGAASWYALHRSTQPDSKAPDPKPRTGERDGTLVAVDPGPSDALDRTFTQVVQPFLKRYCVSCHGAKQPEAELDLTRDATAAAVVKNLRHW